MSGPVNQIIRHQIRLNPPVGSGREKTSALRVSSSSCVLVGEKTTCAAAASGILHGFMSVRYGGPACWMECACMLAPSRVCDWSQIGALQCLVYIPQGWLRFTKCNPDYKLIHRYAHILTNSQNYRFFSLLYALAVFLYSSQRFVISSLTSSFTTFVPPNPPPTFFCSLVTLATVLLHFPVMRVKEKGKVLEGCSLDEPVPKEVAASLQV